MLAVWVVPFQLTGQPQATIDQIAWNWWPVRVLYVMVGASTAVCTWHRLRRDVRRLARPLNRPETPPEGSLSLADVASGQLADRLRRHGYTVTPREAGFDAVRHRWSPIGGTVFHFALLAFVAAVILQHSYGASAEMRVTEGQSFSEAAAGAPDWARSAVAGLRLTSIEPRYYKDVLLFTRLDAALEAADGDASTLSLSSPRWIDPFIHLTVQDFGLAPHVRTVDSAGTIVDDVIVAMNIFPPGAEDSVTLPLSGLTLSVVAYPDHGVVDGQDVSLSYNIRNPVFRVTAQSTQDRTIVGRGIVAIDEPMAAGKHTLAVTGLSRYGTFRIFRSYAPPLALLAGALTLVGLLARFGYPRHDVVVWDTDRGVAVDAWLDAFGRDEGRKRIAALLEGVE